MSIPLAALIVATALLAPACATRDWSAEGRTPEQARADRKTCRAVALKESLFRRGRIFDACMRERGWSSSPEELERHAAAGFCERWRRADAKGREKLLEALFVEGIECEGPCTASDLMRLPQHCLVDQFEREAARIGAACESGGDFSAGFTMGTIAIRREEVCFGRGALAPLD